MSNNDLSKCQACQLEFSSTQANGERRAHFKSDLHVYNTKRKVVGLDPVSEELFEMRAEQVDSISYFLSFWCKVPTEFLVLRPHFVVHRNLTS